MPFVERSDSGEVVGAYHRPQPGRATEYLADDHADLVAFKNKKDSARQVHRDKRAAEALAPSDIEALAKQIEGIVAVPARTAEFAALLARLNSK